MKLKAGSLERKPKLANPLRKKRERVQINKIKNEKGNLQQTPQRCK